jgi:hypothetical protein
MSGTSGCRPGKEAKVRHLEWFVVAMLAIVIAHSQPVWSSCADAALISTIDESSSPLERTHIWTEGYFNAHYYSGFVPYSTEGPPFTPNFNAVWWEMGRGAANNGTNYWNSVSPRGWVYYEANTYYGYPNTYFHGAQIWGGWGQGGVADCVTTGACTCLLLEDAYDNAGYWAVTGNNNDMSTRTTLLRQPGNDPAGNASPIILRPVPVPTILDTTPPGAGTTARVDADLTADYQLGTCDCISGYKIFYQEVPDGLLPPTDRDVSLWTEVSGQPTGGTAFGEPITFAIPCEADHVAYLATQIVGDQGFATGRSRQRRRRGPQ